MSLGREQAFPGQGDAIDLNAELRGCVTFDYSIIFDGPEFSNSLAEALIDNNIDDMEYSVLNFLDVASMQKVVSQP